MVSLLQEAYLSFVAKHLQLIDYRMTNEYLGHHPYQ